MHRKKVLRELLKARYSLSIIGAAAGIEGLNGLAEGMSKITLDIHKWHEIIEEASDITFPNEVQYLDEIRDNLNEIEDPIKIVRAHIEDIGRIIEEVRKI